MFLWASSSSLQNQGQMTYSRTTKWPWRFSVAAREWRETFESRISRLDMKQTSRRVFFSALFVDSWTWHDMAVRRVAPTLTYESSVRTLLLQVDSQQLELNRWTTASRRTIVSLTMKNAGASHNGHCKHSTLQYSTVDILKHCTVLYFLLAFCHQIRRNEIK